MPPTQKRDTYADVVRRSLTPNIESAVDSVPAPGDDQFDVNVASAATAAPVKKDRGRGRFVLVC